MREKIEKGKKWKKRERIQTHRERDEKGKECCLQSVGGK